MSIFSRGMGLDAGKCDVVEDIGDVEDVKDVEDVTDFTDVTDVDVT